MADKSPNPSQESPEEESGVLKTVPLDNLDKRLANELADVRSGIESMYRTTVEAVMRAYEFRIHEWIVKKDRFFEEIQKKYELPQDEQLDYKLDLNKGIVLVRVAEDQENEKEQ
jgi:hypothetical protein